MRQYWRPLVLRARARRGRRHDERWSLDGATAYVERNWGNGFPPDWWWGEAHVLGGDPVTVAFAAVYPASAARRRSWSTWRRALIRLGEPVIAGVRAEVAPGRWALRAARCVTG